MLAYLKIISIIYHCVTISLFSLCYKAIHIKCPGPQFNEKTGGAEAHLFFY